MYYIDGDVKLGDTLSEGKMLSVLDNGDHSMHHKHKPNQFTKHLK